jgi:hypothetical protein
VLNGSSTDNFRAKECNIHNPGSAPIETDAALTNSPYLTWLLFPGGTIGCRFRSKRTSSSH